MIVGKAITAGGSGGIPCTLTVTTAEGALVEATLGSKKVSATAGADGTAILLLEKEGLWTISATLDGETKSTEVLVEHNIEEELVFVDPVLENNTWEFISEVARKGKASQYWNIGDTKQITYNNVVYEVQIIGFDHDTVENPATYGREKAGITFQFKETPKAKIYMNNADREDSSSWQDSTLRNAMYSYRTLFEQSLQNVMVRIVHDFDTSYKNGAGYVAQCSDLLFALSEAEYIGSRNKAANILGTQYEFYAAGNSRIKYEVGTTTADDYWTRSKSSKTSNDYFVYINALGDVATGYSFTTNYGGTPFAFCV